MKYGVQERIHFDQGRIFEGSLIAELCKMYQAKKNHTTSNNPQLNGKCDRFNLTLAFVVPREKHRWPGHLPNLLFICNSTVHSSTGFTPFCLFMGRNPRLPLDSMLCFGEDGEEGELNITMYVEQRVQKLKATYEETSSEETATDQIFLLAPLFFYIVTHLGHNKIQDALEPNEFVVLERIDPDPDRYVYRVKPKDG